MSTVTRPKGPLPARVYWTRRLLVLGVALGMVFGLNQLLGGEPPAAGGPSARPAAATPKDDGELTVTAAPVPSAVGAEPDAPEPKKRTAKKAKAPLAEPSGTCTNGDIAVTPTVKGNAYAGEGVSLTLELNTLESPACHWEVSADSVVVRITSGDDRIWSTQDCPAAVETQPVVVRKDHTTSVEVFWHGQRSDEECSRSTLWALPGYYYATAAALGGEPGDHQFRLLTPPTPTITPTPKPTKKSDGDEADTGADAAKQDREAEPRKQDRGKRD